MRFKILNAAIAAVVAVSLNSEAEAQSKFDRSKKKTSKAETEALPETLPKEEANKKSKSDKSTAAKKDEKVDISDLENRYWTAKDTEFTVVQNRIFTKAKKFSLTATIGPTLNDPYTVTTNFGVAVNYYFSERSGVELLYLRTNTADAELIGRLATNGGVPDHNLTQQYIGLSYNWIPIYAKLSLLEQKILYFDMSVSPGIGLTTMSSAQYANPSGVVAASRIQSPVTFSLDVAQQVFLSEHWAIRLDLRNHFYSETLYGAISGNQLSTKFIYTGSVMLGVTFFQ